MNLNIVNELIDYFSNAKWIFNEKEDWVSFDKKNFDNFEKQEIIFKFGIDDNENLYIRDCFIKTPNNGIIYAEEGSDVFGNHEKDYIFFKQFNKDLIALNDVSISLARKESIHHLCNIEQLKNMISPKMKPF